VFVRHACDIGLLTIAVTKSSVNIRGKLERAPGATSELTQEVLEEMIREIMGVKNVRRLDMDRENWRRAEAGKRKKVK